jgi:hypothetical protein
MLFNAIVCPSCQSMNIVKHGVSGEGKDRYKGLPKNKLFILKNNNHSRSVGGSGRWPPPPSRFCSRINLVYY